MRHHLGRARHMLLNHCPSRIPRLRVVKKAILTSSLAISTIFPLLRRMLAMLKEQKFLLKVQIQYERSKWVVIGQLPGMQPSKQLHMLSHTEIMSCNNGETIFHQSSQPGKPAPTTNSSPLTKQSGLRLQEDKQSCSLAVMNSLISTLPSFSLMEFRQNPLDDKEIVTTESRWYPLISAIDSTAQTCAKSQQEPAASITLSPMQTIGPWKRKLLSESMRQAMACAPNTSATTSERHQIREKMLIIVKHSNA